MILKPNTEILKFFFFDFIWILPLLIQQKLSNFQKRIQTEIEEFPHNFQVGSIIYLTDNLKIALMQEIGNWKMAFGRAMNEKGKIDVLILLIYKILTNI